jgi:hypothetical protein
MGTPPTIFVVVGPHTQSCRESLWKAPKTMMSAIWEQLCMISWTLDRDFKSHTELLARHRLGTQWLGTSGPCSARNPRPQATSTRELPAGAKVVSCVQCKACASHGSGHHGTNLSWRDGRGGCRLQNVPDEIRTLSLIYLPPSLLGMLGLIEHLIMME